MSNTVAGRRQFDNSQECIAKKRQWRRHANENTLEQNASIIDGSTARRCIAIVTNERRASYVIPLNSS